MLKRVTLCAAAVLALAGAQEDDTVVETPADATAPQHNSAKQHKAPAVILDGDTPPEVETPPPPEETPTPAPQATPQPAPTRQHPRQSALPKRELPPEALKAMRQSPQQPAEEDKHVVSQSRMFSVSGGDALRMGAIATKADEVRGAVCRLMGVDTAWKYGISIRLIGKSTDPPELHPIRTRISILGSEPNFQIRVYPGGGIDVERLTNAIITMTLFERALCNQRADALPDSVNIPHWLITGVQQAVLWRSGKGDRRLYRSLFERGEMLSPESIISTERPERLDATSRRVYEASCGVLIMCLVNREGGPAQLREMIEESAMTDGSPKEIIMSHFHELSIDANMLSKWWALELAALSQAPATEMLTPAESEKQLAEALQVLVYDPETLIPRTISMDNAYELVELPDRRSKIKSCVERLMELNLRCFPGYRAIIMEYCRALHELDKGAKADEVQDILLPLLELRQAYITTSLRARDYLDWYEITHLGEKSHQEGFTAYLETMSLLRREKPGADTPMSRYLEDIESLYTQASGEELPAPLLRQVREARKNAKQQQP